MAQKSKTLATEVARYIDEAWILVGQGALDDAHATLDHAQRIAKAGGLRSAFLFWGLAVVADLRDYAEDAVHFIMAALRLEPCAPPILKSYIIIRRKTRNTFAALGPFDPAVSHIFGLLQKLDAVDAAACHKYSECARVHGDRETALIWAREAVASEPPTPERLRHLARLLAADGHVEEAHARLQEADDLMNTFPCPRATA